MAISPPADIPGVIITAPVINYKKPGDLFSVFPEFEYIGKPSGVWVILELVGQEEDAEGISPSYRFGWNIPLTESTTWKHHYGAFNGRLHADTKLGWYDAVTYLEIDGQIVLWHLTTSAFYVRSY